MSRPISMTPQRMAILCFIVAYHDAHKFSPSQREIAEHIDSLRPQDDHRETSTSTVKFHITKLIKQGYLVGEPGTARGYAPTPNGIQYVKEINHASNI